MANLTATIDGCLPLEKRSESRFALVTAGHHFLLRALPFRHPETELALQAFSLEATACALSEADHDAVLLRCLRVVDRHTGGRLPTLVEQYLTQGTDPGNSIARFSACIRRVLRYRGVGDPRIQEAVSIIDERYSDASLTQHEVALSVETCPATFSTQFRRETGVRFREFVRDHRLDQGAALLAATNKTVKEVWASVGYNHASNFAHDFKRRFGMSPRKYRERVIRVASQERPIASRRAPAYRPLEQGGTHKTVLVVDDDESTQELIGTCLRLDGYAVDVASSGTEGLRAADTTSPDAILLEYRLSDMDGLTFLRALRNRRPGSIRVALFTADWDIYDRKAELSALNAIVASKLCDRGGVQALVAYLVSGS